MPFTRPVPHGEWGRFSGWHDDEQIELMGAFLSGAPVLAQRTCLKPINRDRAGQIRKGVSFQPGSWCQVCVQWTALDV